MALVYPLSLAAFGDLLPIASVTFSPRRSEEVAGLASGQALVAEVAPPLWQARVDLAAMPHAEAGRIAALIDALDGSQKQFFLTSPAHAYPAADPGGVLLGASAVTIQTVGGDNKSLALAGLPAGYALTAGDFLCFDVGGARAFHRLAESGAANGGGVTAALELRPYLRAGTVAGLAVTLKKPAAKMILAPGSFEPGASSRSLKTGMAFEALEKAL